MLYEVLSQSYIFLWLTVGGFLCGFLFDIKNILVWCFKKNKIISHVIMFFCVFLLLLISYYLNLKTNYGQFRLYPIFAFSLAFSIQRFLILNFVANPVVKCYNKQKEKNNGKKKMVEKS